MNVEAEDVIFFALGLALLAAAMVTQIIKRLPNGTVIGVHAALLPFAMLAIGYAVTGDIVFSLVFGTVLSVLGVTTVGWTLNVRRNRESRR